MTIRWTNLAAAGLAAAGLTWWSAAPAPVQEVPGGDASEAPIVRRYPLQHAPVSDVYTLLRRLYQDEPQVASIADDERRQTVIVRATPTVQAQIAALVEDLDVE